MAGGLGLGIEEVRDGGLGLMGDLKVRVEMKK